jgi:hypothetical protein
VLDLVVSFLMATLINDIFKKLHQLTGLVPPLIMRISGKLEQKAEQKLETMTDVDA